jgi:hypothetical protein
LNKREIHKDYREHLERKEQSLIDLYSGLRDYILDIHPTSNELLYHTHALTSLYSVSEKMSDGFCMIVIYTNHLNLAFNEGTLLADPHKLLQGTGKLMRHIPISTEGDFKNDKVLAMIKSAIEMATEGSTAKTMNQGLTITKIKN